jgi:hypothetical protein
VKPSPPTLGRAGDVEVSIDVERLVDTRLLIQASSGGGKSWAIRRILEQTHGKVQQLVLDVEGEFHTLAERFDYVLAGRKDGDCPAHPRAAPLLAKRLLELGVSAVIDLYELESHERFAFVRAFLKALIDADRALWHPALVVVDEAHVFCPEHGKAESAGAVIDLCTRGRKRGFAAVLATQRLSKLHKDAAAECVNKLVGRCQLDIDMRRAGDELGLVGKNEHLQLRALKPGHFFAFGPAFGVAGVERIEVGPVETKHLRPGERAARAVAPRDAVMSVLSQLADIPREAEQEAKDLSEARAQLAAARRELAVAKRGAPAPDPATIEKAVGDARLDERRRAARMSKGVADRITAVSRALEVVQKAVNALAEQFARESAQLIGVTTAAAAGIAPPPAARNGVAHPVPIATNRLAQSSRAPRAAASDALARPQQRVLDALAWLEMAIGDGSYPREQVGAVSGYAPTSGNFGNILGQLAAAALISYPAPGKVALTDEGRSSAIHPYAPTSADEIQRRLLDRLSGPQRKVLEAVLAGGREPQTRAEIAEAAGYAATSGNFGNLLGKLSTLGAIRYPAAGQVAPAPWLYLEEARA